MPKFNVPVVLQVKADSEEEAHVAVRRLMHAADTYAQENEPKLYKAFKNWDFAEIQIRAVGDR